MDYITPIQIRDINIDFRDCLESIDRSVFKKAFNPSRVWRRLNTPFSLEKWNDRLKQYRSTIVLKEGEFDGPDVLGSYWGNDHCCIEVEIHNINKFANLDEIKFQVIQCIMHEMIHANQFFLNPNLCDSTIERQGNRYKDYHSKFGEIEAFSHCIALEYLRTGKWGEGPTIGRYDDCTTKIKKVLNKNIKIWVDKYQDLI